MKAVIMAGGFGTRLRPLTEGVPKPCVPIVGVPCIVRMVRHLAAMGIREFHVSVFYLPEQIREALSVPEFQDLSITFHMESIPLGTAGSVKNCLSGCEDDFLVVSGDGVFDFDLLPAVAFHLSHGGPITIVSSRVEDPGEYGVMLCNEEGRILRFLEKPDWTHAYSDDVNTGIYICSRSFLENIPEGHSDFSKDVFPVLLEKGIPIYRYAAEGFWCDIGTVSSYLECNRQVLSKNGDQFESPIDEHSVVESPCYIGKNVRLYRCHIGPYTVIGDGCVLSETRLEGCVLDRGVRCEPGSVLRNAVVCKNTLLRANCRVGDDSVIGSDCEIGIGATVPAGVKIFPSNRIPGGCFVSGNVHHRLRSLLPEDGKILFPFGEDFGGAMIYEVGRALAQLFDGDVAVGRAEQKDASAAMTFCGGVLACGKNVYDTGVNDLSRFRFTVRNYAFRCGAFFQRNYSNLVLRLFDENGMPLSASCARNLSRLLSQECACGETDGIYRIFRGGSKSYQNYLRSFGLPSKLMLRVISSPVLSPLLPRSPENDARERMRVGSEWVRIERPDGEPFDEDLIRLCVLISFGLKQSPVYFPYSYPYVAEQLADRFGFRALRIPNEDRNARKLFPLTDPNIQALLILDLLEREKCTFAQFIESFPSFASKQRDISVSLRKGAVMRAMASSGGELLEGIRIFDRSGVVRIVPKQNANAFRIYSESVSPEQAEELCEFYAMKLKGLKPD